MTPPPPGRRRVPGPGRLGLVEDDADTRLERLGWTTEERVPLLWSLSRAGDPDLALAALCRLADALGDAGWAELETRLAGSARLRGRLFGVLGASTTLGDHLVAHPASWRRLDTTEHLPGPDEVRALLLAAVDARPEGDGTYHRAAVTGPEAVAALRVAYRHELLLVAAVDTGSVVEDVPVAPFREVGEQLTTLADAALTAALAVAVAEVCPDGPPPVRLAVIAMGKCGARELNYVSDVDVIFVAEPADAVAARLAGALVRIGGAAFFEVDPNLRPEGRNGALVRTLESHLAYYDRWARTWEFQALLKARPMTGDLALGAAYLDAVTPLVWSAAEREDFVGDVQAMRRRVEDSVPPELRERELKLGRGGLRDVEFAVQLIQLVHGRADASLRVAATVDVLAAMGVLGYVGRDDAANLIASYEFLRLLEHRLQLQHLRRTHTLPAADDERNRRWLARAAHLRTDGTDPVTALAAEVRRHAQRIRRLHEKLFYRPLLDSVAKIDAAPMRLSTDAARRQLAALGYLSPDSALQHLTSLTAGVGRTPRVQAVLLPTLLEWLAETPNPDAGLLAYTRLSAEVREQQWFLRMLRDEGVVASRLVRVLGTSAYTAELLLRSPEVVRLYADGAVGPRLLDPEPAEVARSLRAAAERHDEPVRAAQVARSLRRAELVRVSSADVLGLLDTRQVCEALSAVADAALDAALVAATRAAGPEPRARLAVIGMGRLGGSELGYGSDADVLFVCEPLPGVDERTATRWASTVAERVTTLLGAPSPDPALGVDSGLRPEGRSGALVRTVASYEAYYRQWGATWERQALVRARPVAGDAELGERFLAVVDPLRYPEGGLDRDGVREVRRIKARVDAERLPRGADPTTHTKLGRGGLADIEWTAQLLQLRHAHRLPALRTPSTLDALRVAGAAELLPAGDADVLVDAWLEVTRARNAVVLVRGKAADQLPPQGRLLDAVAVATGWPAGDSGAFQDHYRRVTRRARQVVEASFGA
ncbi:bifunctional [glutamine synthetase] adenylyltransferase/[glutamine synthetase]-adenylyl-L-tyrosine phosphorylase [Rhodococcus aerolatus]